MRCVNNNCQCDDYWGPLDDTGNMRLNCPLCGEEAEVGEKEADWIMWNRERGEVAALLRDANDPSEVHEYVVQFAPTSVGAFTHFLTLERLLFLS